MKKARNQFIKNLRYLCLIGVIALGLITIVGSNGGGEEGGGETTSDHAAATIDDFAGVWQGSGTFEAEDETHSGNITLSLSIDGNTLVGNYVYRDEDPVNISGTITDGVFTFDVPNSEPNDPDCANWDVVGTATLDESLTTMSLSYSGTFCGAGGGKPGTFSATLTKEQE